MDSTEDKILQRIQQAPFWGAIDLSRGRMPTDIVWFPTVLSPVGAIHLPSSLIHLTSFCSQAELHDGLRLFIFCGFKKIAYLCKLKNRYLNCEPIYLDAK